MAGTGTAGTGPSSGGSGGGIAGSGGSGGWAEPGICGNGTQEWNEECDLGDTIPGDGCSAGCTIEPGYACYFDSCHLVVCGDGIQDWYAVGGGLYDYEECDDGNASGDDGCSDSCDIEPGFVCTTPGQPCREVECGDGFQDAYFVPGDPGSGSGGSAGTGMGGAAGGGASGTWVFEACDDGNTVGDDGCSDSCDLEIGFVCLMPGEPCREVQCGDGFQDGYFVPGDPGSGAGGSAGTGAGTGGAAGGASGTWVFEACDDGNIASGDGCTGTCDVEPGYLCEVPGTPCREPRCGDGIQDFIWTPGGGGSGGSAGGFGGTGGSAGGSGFYENCDDGNVVSGDGCTSECNIEDGYICPTPGTPCRIPTCGDGFVDYIPNPDGCEGEGAGGGGSGSGGSGGTFTAGTGGGVSCGTYEQCDDGNVTPSDGCSATCTQEEGYVCYEPGRPCTVPVCGNGIPEWPAEECDDGNTEPNDGCFECRGEWW